MVSDSGLRQALRAAAALALLLTVSCSGSGQDRSLCQALGVPAYFHPTVDPPGWRALDAGRVRFVVLNPSEDGPGKAVDPTYLEILPPAGDRDWQMLGYIDTRYGQRPPDLLVAQLRSYLDWYAVDGVFLDQVTSDAEHVEYYRSLSQALRDAGASRIVLNPGVHPDPAYADLADSLVTFENDVSAYRDLQLPAWTHTQPATKFWHIVHGVPARDLREVLSLSAERRASTVMITDGDGANPYDHLPSYIQEERHGLDRSDC